MATISNKFSPPPRPGPNWKRLPELREITPNIDRNAEIQPTDPGTRMPADYGNYYPGMQPVASRQLNPLLMGEPRDFADRLGRIRPGTIDADRGMVAQPPVDPGYAMPNASEGNLNQSPGQEVQGWLPAKNALLLELLRRYGISPRG